MKLMMTKAEKKDLKEIFENEYGRKVTYKTINKFLNEFSFVVHERLIDFVNEEDYNKEYKKRQDFRRKWGKK